MISRIKPFLIYLPYVFLFVISLEILARIDDTISYGANPLGPYDPESMLLDRDENGVKGKAHGHYEKWMLNSLGFRGPEVVIPKPSGLLRIVTLGASETFGQYESAGEEWPNQLRRELKSAFPDKQIEVVNVAIVGLTMGSLARYYHHRVEGLHPDIVLLYPHFVEFVAGKPPRKETQVAKTGSVQKTNKAFSSFGPSRFLPKLKIAIKSKAPSFFVTWVQNRILQVNLAKIDTSLQISKLDTVRLATFDSLLSQFSQQLQNQGVALMVSEYACTFQKASREESIEGMENLWRRYPWMSRSLLVNGLQVYNQHIAEIANRNGALFIPEATLLVDYQKNWVGDGIHFTDAGARAIMRNFFTPLSEWLAKK